MKSNTPKTTKSKTIKAKKSLTQPKHLFFLTMTKDSGESKPIGVFETFDEVKTILYEQPEKVQGGFYHYAIVEEIAMGIFKEVYSRWQYDYDVLKNRFVCTHSSEVAMDCQSFFGMYA